MKKLILLFLLLLFFVNASAYNKTKYDLDLNSNQNLSFNKISGLNSGHETVSNSKTEATLLPDGYFTLGTTGGISQDTLDNNCQITFGHPYAMTSYPFFIIDETRQLPENYFYNQAQILSVIGDTLRLIATDYLTVKLNFDIIQQNDGDSIRIECSLENLDSISHYIGLGMVFDPAIGKWGDGYSFVNNQLIENDTLLQSSILENIEIWERNVTPKGMGLQLSFPDNTPDKIHIGNWFDIHQDQTVVLPQLYDLALEMEWTEEQILPLQKKSYSIKLAQLSPDFSTDLFLRADLPRFLSIENNLLFPRSIEPLVEIFNNGNTTVQDVKLQITSESVVENWTSPDSFDINIGDLIFKKTQIKIPEIYEDRIVNISLNAVENSQYLDQLSRNIYIPAAPFSDIGLLVDIDTIMTPEFPRIDMIFGSKVEASGQLLTDLGDENIFLYEDQFRIQDFVLEKDTSGGTNQADIIFVLDVTGSMGNEIAGVKDNIVEFTDSLSYRGIDFRLGMVTFLDEIENIYNFTSDVQLFQQYVSQQYAHGGGNYTENSLVALMRAAQFNFRPSANRVFIWITDADYHINNSYTQLTQQDVVNEMLSKAIVAHCIGNSAEQTDFYDAIVLPTGGKYFNINGNFKDILLDISRMRTSGKYKITYYSNASTGTSHEVKLELHYAGLGGHAITTYIPSASSAPTNEIPKISCYPNPFNPIIRFNIYNPNRFKGDICIYNVLGQKIKELTFASGQDPVQLFWNATDHNQKAIGTGIYLVKTTLYGNESNTNILPIQKVIYVK